MSSDTMKDEKCESVDSTKYRGMIEVSDLITKPGHSELLSQSIMRTVLMCTYRGRKTLYARSVEHNNRLVVYASTVSLQIVKHAMYVFLELAIDHYISHDRVMHLLAPHYERKTRSDHGKKRPRESNASSSSTTVNHPSLSRPLDDTIDVNDDESFHFNSSSPYQNFSSSSNVVPRVHQNPPHESHNLNTYLSVTISL
ncbi:hypothetical protein Tco_1498991 [Tanacetum coccineum]